MSVNSSSSQQNFLSLSSSCSQLNAAAAAKTNVTLPAVDTFKIPVHPFHHLQGENQPPPATAAVAAAPFRNKTLVLLDLRRPPSLVDFSDSTIKKIWLL